MRDELHAVDEVNAWKHFPYPPHHYSSLVLLQAFIYYFFFVYMYAAGTSKQYVQLYIVLCF